MLKNKYQFFNFGMSFCLPAVLLWQAGILIFGFWIFSFAQSEFTYDAQGKRNPFIPLVTSDGKLLKLEREETTGDLFLEGIIYDEHGVSYAIVNSKVVKIGDLVDDYQVLKIEKEKVIFIKDDEPVEIELKKGEK